MQQQSGIGIIEKADSIAVPTRPVDRGMPESEQARVKCLACDLIQVEAEWCRRCRKKLPKPAIREVIKEVQVTVVVDVATFGPKAPVLPMAEYERLAIVHALKRSENGGEAARALGIGKTTLYRKLIEYRKSGAEGCIAEARKSGAGHE